MSDFLSAGLRLLCLEDSPIVLRTVGVTGAGPNDHPGFLDDLP